MTHKSREASWSASSPPALFVVTWITQRRSTQSTMAKSGRRLPHSRTLTRETMTHKPREASWSASSPLALFVGARIITPFSIPSIPRARLPQWPVGASPHSPLPGDDCAIAQKFAGKILRRLRRQPDNRICSLLNRSRRLLTAHIRLDPTGTNRIDGEKGQTNR